MRITKSKSVTGLFLLGMGGLALAPDTARAGLLLEQPLESPPSAFASNVDGEQSADDLALSGGPVDVLGVTWYGNFWDGRTSGDFEFRLFANDGFGFPAITPTSSIDMNGVSGVGTGFVDGAGFEVLEFEWTFAVPLSVNPAADEFLSIVGDGDPVSVLDDFFWATSDGGNDEAYFRFGEGDLWFDDPGIDHAFALRVADATPVPAPGTAWLLVLGALWGVARVGRRRPEGRPA